MFLFDLLFPIKCVACGRNGSYLCQECVRKLPRPALQICPICRKPSYSGFTHKRCKTEFFPDGNLSLFLYKFPLVQFLIELKYRFSKEVSLCLNEVVKNGLQPFAGIINFWQKENFVILPIPLFERRFLWRGFNQSELIAEAVRKITKLKVDLQILERIKNTGQQSKLTLKQRKNNIKNAFSTAKIVKSGNFLLVDDVLTSGETMKEAVKTLKLGGANLVWGLTLMRK